MKNPGGSLADKGLALCCHVIEESPCSAKLRLHIFTTGSTAFQHVVGVMSTEIPDRIAASLFAFEMAGITSGSKG